MPSKINAREIHIQTNQSVKVLFSHQVTSDPFWTHRWQHARLPCPSPSPRVCQVYVLWISGAIQPSYPVTLFSLCCWSFPASVLFPEIKFLYYTIQSVLKEINPECSLEGLILKLKLQYFRHLMWTGNSLEK